MITNAVRCVPPQNKPTPLEAKTCLQFLSNRFAALPKLRAVLALGRIAHESVITAHDLKRSKFAFGHQASHDIGNGVRLFDSYHCSRYNTNTRRLTPEMFHAVFQDIRSYLDKA